MTDPGSTQPISDETFAAPSGIEYQRMVSGEPYLPADPELVADLRSVPEGQELVDDLAAACSGVAMSRRFLNDGVQAARLLRSGRLVRLFRLAGHAPMPVTFEMDDEMAGALAPYA